MFPTTSDSLPAGISLKPSNLRTFLRQPLLPQLTEHSPVFQSPQRQYSSFTGGHSSHFSTTCESPASQAWPVPEAWRATPRVRVLSPSQRVHSRHSSQMPQAQSAGAMHGFGLQGATSRNWSSQGVPPFFGKDLILRSRVICPPSQVVVHVVHSCHSSKVQSTGSWPSKPQASSLLLLSSFSKSFAPLHDVTSWSATPAVPLPHSLPEPEPGTSMVRDRECTPSQLLEHESQTDHSPILQSVSSRHFASLHLRTSVDSPSTGSPQAEAWMAMVLCLHSTPAPQVREHSPHSSQTAQSPSMHSS
mmetsp:Transcript_86549/g.279356  ORF Transcript_86549/g.279356 Transcript_86549/m.279356 type:complete len:303 (+) Transcript_86549:2756-3664(+)